MYLGTFQNPVTALNLVETLVDAFHEGVAGATPGWQQEPGISVCEYNHLVHCYNAQVQQSQAAILELEFQLQAARAENLRLQAQLVRYASR